MSTKIPNLSKLIYFLGFAKNLISNLHRNFVIISEQFILLSKKFAQS